MGATLRVVDVQDGVATISVDATASGLPAHKLLGLAASRIESVVAAKGLPAGSVRVLPDARSTCSASSRHARRARG